MPGIGKRKQTLYIDSRPKAPFATSGADGGAFDGSAAAGAIPVPPTIPAPTGLTLTPGLLQSAVTPSAKIDAVWSNLETNDQETYRVQVATDSGFTAVVGIWATGQNQASAVIQPLKVSTTYYVRVQTIVGNSNSDWSSTVSTTTGADTTVPAAPTSQAGAWAGIGDFVITWVNPTSTNFRAVEITIYSQSGGVLYATVLDATQRYVWTAAQNLAATSGVGDPSLYAELRSLSYGGVYSSLVNTGLVTKAAPATPTVTLVAGSTQQLVAAISSARGVDVAQYEFIFKRDGTNASTKLTTDNFALYELSGASDAGNHSWTVVARARDGLLQYSASSSASGAVVVDALTIDYLRGGLAYSDSDANTFTPPSSGTLAALKDGVTASGGVTYAA